jgi:hypothetical protein
MANEVYPVTTSLSSSDLFQIWSFGKIAPPFIKGAQLVAAAINPSDVYNTNTATDTTSLTAANITGGWNTVTLNMTGSLGAAGTATFPTVTATVAAIETAFPGVTVPANKSVRLRVINSSGGNFAWTITGGTGWTLAGTRTVAQNTWRDFLITFASGTAATLQSVGTGTNS